MLLTVSYASTKGYSTLPHSRCTLTIVDVSRRPAHGLAINSTDYQHPTPGSITEYSRYLLPIGNKNLFILPTRELSPNSEIGPLVTTLFSSSVLSSPIARARSWRHEPTQGPRSWRRMGLAGETLLSRGLPPRTWGKNIARSVKLRQCRHNSTTTTMFRFRRKPRPAAAISLRLLHRQ